MMKQTNKWLIVRKFYTVGNECLSYREEAKAALHARKRELTEKVPMKKKP